MLTQCLDNQYVSDDVLSALVRREAGFADRRIRALREREVRREFAGSLLYAQQIVVNRAFFHNNDLLYGMYEHDRAAFAALLKDEALIPYLHAGETELGGDMSFTSADDGKRALASLLDVVGTGYAVVHVDAQRARAMGGRFCDYCTRLATLSEPEAAVLARDVDPARRRSDGAVRRFHRAVVHAGETAARLHREGRLRRETLYAELFGDDLQSVARGTFRAKPPIGDQIGAVKKLIDLCYNTALPGALGRFFASPDRFPTWTALHEDVVLDRRDAPPPRGFAAAVATVAHAHLRARADRNRRIDMVSFGDLSLDDVVELRGLRAWTAFMAAQNELTAASATHLDDAIAAYFEQYVVFQERVASWARARRREATVKRVVVAIEPVLTFAGLAASFFPEANEVVHPASASLESVLRDAPETVQAAQLSAVIDVYDAATHRAEREHRRLLRLADDRTELMRSELHELVRDLGERRFREVRYDGPGHTKGTVPA